MKDEFVVLCREIQNLLNFLELVYWILLCKCDICGALSTGVSGESEHMKGCSWKKSWPSFFLHTAVKYIQAW